MTELIYSHVQQLKRWLGFKAIDASHIEVNFELAHEINIKLIWIELVCRGALMVL